MSPSTASLHSSPRSLPTGTFFQASLLPYIFFLYFLQYAPNKTPNLGNFGFQYLLLFVLATIPSGIVSKIQYGETLANVDWLHGGAEGLLTLTSLLVVAGFRDKSVEGGMGVEGNEGKIKGTGEGGEERSDDSIQNLSTLQVQYNSQPLSSTLAQPLLPSNRPRCNLLRLLLRRYLPWFLSPLPLSVWSRRPRFNPRILPPPRYAP